MYNSEKIIKFTEIDSTHKYLKNNYKDHEHGSVVIADTQTNGVGTKGRNWYTGKDNIAISILYKPNFKINKLDGLTVKIAETMQELIRELYDINLMIKEPNDLLINGKKVSGILTEINTIGEDINYLIISIGFNVNEINFPRNIENMATSLKKEFGNGEFNKELIIEKIIYKIEKLVANII